MAKNELHHKFEDSYVYEIIVDDVVRYVGKGTGDRVSSHIKIASTVFAKMSKGIKPKQPRLYFNLARSIRAGSVVSSRIVRGNLSHDGAFEMERAHVSTFPDGQLWNAISGGRGASSIDMQRLSADPAIRKSRSEVAKRNWADPAYRKTITDGMKQRWEDPVFRAAMTETLNKLKKEPDRRRAASEKQKKLWEGDFRRHLEEIWRDPERLAQHSDRAKRAWENNPGRAKARFSAPDARKIQSDMVKAKWSDPAYREMQILARANGKKRMETKFSEKRSTLAKARWANPEFRERVIAAMRRSKSLTK